MKLKDVPIEGRFIFFSKKKEIEFTPSVKSTVFIRGSANSIRRYKDARAFNIYHPPKKRQAGVSRESKVVLLDL